MDAAERSEVIADLAREHADAVRAIMDANEDLSERLSDQGTYFVYDEEDDFFAIMIGPPVEAVTESIANTILFRVEPETLKIVGIEIFDFEKRRKHAPGAAAHMVEFWAPVVEALRAGRDATGALRRLVRGHSVRELVPA